jgi:TPR repeat protein
MFCILCRYLIDRSDPGWTGKADELQAAHRLYGLNNDAPFEADADPTRLREIYELWRSRPAEAFVQFLSLAESGSVWSMMQVGYAYETGRGVPLDRVRAEDWYLKAHEKGSDYCLFRVSALAMRRSDFAKARTILDIGVARGLTRAMDYLAWMELKLSRNGEARRRARALYEQAIASGDFAARMSYAHAVARGRFGLREIPAGIRSLLAAAKDFSAQVDAEKNAQPRT